MRPLSNGRWIGSLMSLEYLGSLLTLYRASSNCMWSICCLCFDVYSYRFHRWPYCTAWPLVGTFTKFTYSWNGSLAWGSCTGSHVIRFHLHSTRPFCQEVQIFAKWDIIHSWLAACWDPCRGWWGHTMERGVLFDKLVLSPSTPHARYMSGMAAWYDAISRRYFKHPASCRYGGRARQWVDPATKASYISAYFSPSHSCSAECACLRVLLLLFSLHTYTLEDYRSCCMPHRRANYDLLWDASFLDTWNELPSSSLLVYRNYSMSRILQTSTNGISREFDFHPRAQSFQAISIVTLNEIFNSEFFISLSV